MRWIRNLLSLPFLWAGQLAAAFKLPLAAPLLSAAYAVSGNGATGRTALIAIRALRGRDAARAQGAAWMQSRPSVEVAAIAGLLELECGDAAAARRLLDWGRAHGDDDLGLLDLLEYGVVIAGADASAQTEMLSRLDARRDLPSQLTLLLGKHFLWNAIWRKDFDGAHRRAQHMLEVEDVPEAEMALWAIARQEGRTAQAQAHLDRAKLAPDVKLFHQVIYGRAIGCETEAMELLGQLREINPEMAGRVPDAGPREGAAS